MIVEYVDTSIYKLENTDGDLDPFIERVRDAHYVLLGEASHERQNSILGELKSQSV